MPKNGFSSFVKRCLATCLAKFFYLYSSALSSAGRTLPLHTVLFQEEIF